jgi:hypothetical protein
MATVIMTGRDPESPRLQIIRCIPWGDGYRYLIAEGPASPEVYYQAFKDTCATFPDCPVLVVAEWGNHCEVLDAQHYTALRPVLMGL